MSIIRTLAPILVFAFSAIQAEEQERLSPRQQIWVDAVYKANLIADPTGATRVQVLIPRHSPWGGTYEQWEDAWLYPATENHGERILTTTGLPIPKEHQKSIRDTNFLHACRARVIDSTVRNHEGNEDADLIHRQLYELQQGANNDHPWILAAWLAKKGETTLARHLFSLRKGSMDPGDLNSLREGLATDLKLDMIHAYANRDDREAERQAAWLRQKFPDQFVEDRTVIEQELSRRRKQRGVGWKVDVTQQPDGFEEWPVEKRVAYWIDLLDEVDERQEGQPGGVNLGAHAVVRELVAIGDPALPALIDALETDRRLTRSVHFWRDFVPSRTLLTVREAVLVAIMDILQEDFFFEIASTGDSLSARGDREAVKVAGRIKAYVKRWGDLPFPERMLARMADKSLTLDERRGAMVRLCTYGRPIRHGTMFGIGDVEENQPQGLHPELAKIRDPDLFTRVLDFMENDLKGKTEAQTRRWVLWYCDLLLELGDPRTPATIESFRKYSKDTDYQNQLDFYTRRPGEEVDYRPLLEQLSKGELPQQAGSENLKHRLLRHIGIVIEEAEPKEQDRIFTAFSTEGHPYWDTLNRLTLQGSGFGNPWMKLPRALARLQAMLKDSTPLSTEYRIEDGELVSVYKESKSSRPIPFPEDTPLREEVRLNHRLKAAMLLSEFVAGLPLFHPLFADENSRIEKLEAYLNRYSFRQGTQQETNMLNLWLNGGTIYVPILTPGPDGATEEDVKQGKALFHLPAAGIPLTEQTPAHADFFEEDSDEAVRVLILQAEKDADGTIWYGAVSQYGIHVAQAWQFQKVTSYSHNKQDRVRFEIDDMDFLQDPFGAWEAQEDSTEDPVDPFGQE